MDETLGELTTGKLQALVDASYLPGVRSRRDVATALTAAGEKISIHGVEAWFRHVDSNYNLKRPSLNDREPSYRIPKRRCGVILDLFALEPANLQLADADFRRWCFEQSRARRRGTEPVVLPDAPPLAHPAAWRRLHEVFDQANAGQPGLVLLNGPEGIGKSHLLRGLTEHLQATPALVFSTACAAHTGLPLIPIVEMFRSDRGALLAAGERFEQQFQQIFERYADHSVDGFESPRTFLDLMALLTGLAKGHTVVLCIDDLHLADEATSGFVDYLASQVRVRTELRLMVAGAYRAGEGSGAAGRLVSAVARMSVARCERLDPLDRATLGALLDDQLDVPLSPAAFDQVWRASRGRVGIALELVNRLLHRELLVARVGRLDLAAGFDARDVPADLGVPREALGRLGAEARELLTLASTIGISFGLDVIQELRPKWPLQTILDAIEEAEQLEILGYERDQFRFRSPAVAKALYDAMSDTRRARMHLEFATYLGRRSSRSDLESVALAHHLRRAGPLVTTAELVAACQRAARAAAELAAWPQVVEFAQVALNVDGGDALGAAQQGALLRLLASAWHQSGNADDAIQPLREALERFRSIGDELEIARTLHDLVRIRGNFGRLASAQDPDLDELIQRTRGLAEHDPRLASRAYDSIASRMLYLGDRDQALAYALRARAVVEHDGPSTEKALACIAVALGRLRHLELDAATQALDDALFIALEIGDQHTAARALQRLTLPALALGRLDRVEATYQRVISLEHPLVRTGEMSIPMASLITAHALRGRFEAARVVFEEASELIRETGYFWSQVNVYAAHAFALVAQGRRDEASALIGRFGADSSAAKAQRDLPVLAGYRMLIDEPAATPQQPSDSPTQFAADAIDAGDRQHLDLNAVAKYCLNLDLALRRNHAPGVRVGLDTLRAAHARGVRFSLGWPFCLPHLIARALLHVGRQHEALYHLLAARQLCIEAGARVELSAVQQTLAAAFPEFAAGLGDSPPAAPAPRSTRAERELQGASEPARHSGAAKTI